MIEVPNRALSVIQPWAWAIVEGFKPLENRDWPPHGLPSALGERIAVHASLKFDDDAVETFKEVGGACLNAWVSGEHQGGSLMRGAFVGTVRVRGYVDRGGARTLPRSSLVWFVGDYGWLLEQPVKFSKPIPAKGRLGLWGLDEVQKSSIKTQLQVDYALRDFDKVTAFTSAAKRHGFLP